MGLARSAVYLYRMFANRMAPSLKRRETELNGRPAIEIITESAGSPERSRAILCVHGMTVYGFQDERLLKIASVLASMGYRALVPSYPEIQDLLIDPDSAGQISADIESLAFDTGYQVGLMTASFSGGLSMIGASDPKASECVAALLAVGSYAQVDSTFDYFLNRADVNRYGLLITLKNFLGLIGEPTELLTAFDIAAKDEGFHRASPELDRYLKSQPEPVRQRFDRYVTDHTFRLSQWEKICNRPEAQKVFKAMDVIDQSHHLTTALCLLHGRNDTVIPKEQSEMLYNRLRARLPVRLSISSMIDHGNVKPGLSLVRESVSLLRTLSLFFDRVDAAKPVR